MASYVFIQNYSGKGLIGISNHAFRQIAEHATKNVEGVVLDPKSGDGYWEPTKPIEVIIRANTRVDINVSINLIGKMDVSATCLKIQENIANHLLLMAELIPFKINVKVMAIKTNVEAKK